MSTDRFPAFPTLLSREKEFFINNIQVLLLQKGITKESFVLHNQNTRHTNGASTFQNCNLLQFINSFHISYQIKVRYFNGLVCKEKALPRNDSGFPLLSTHKRILSEASNHLLTYELNQVITLLILLLPLSPSFKQIKEGV